MSAGNAQARLKLSACEPEKFDGAHSRLIVVNNDTGRAAFSDVVACVCTVHTKKMCGCIGGIEHFRVGKNSNALMDGAAHTKACLTNDHTHGTKYRFYGMRKASVESSVFLSR